MLRSCRKTTPVSLFLFLLLLALSTACQTQQATTQQASADTRAADEAAIRKLDDEWSKAAGAKDVEKTISYYADDAIVLPPNTPKLTGKEPIRAMWKSLLGAPGFAGAWNLARVEVARSGDLAYVTGSYDFKENDASGKPMTDKGKYVEVWKKQADGNWKCLIDMFSSDLPPAPPPAVEKKVATAK